MATWGEVSASIAEYYISGWWYDGAIWQSLDAATIMVEGQEYRITVSQDCTLDWDGYLYNFTEGSNTFIWESTKSWLERYAVLLVIAIVFLVTFVLVYRAKW